MMIIDISPLFGPWKSWLGTWKCCWGRESVIRFCLITLMLQDLSIQTSLKSSTD